MTDQRPDDAQELMFRLAQLRLEAAEFRRVLRHATVNVVVMEKAVEEKAFRELEPRQKLPWLRRRFGRIRDAASHLYAASGPLRDKIWEFHSAMAPSDSDLGRLDKLIVEVRARITRQRGIVEKMQSLELDTKAATRLLRTMESTLVDLESDRSLLEDEGLRGGEQRSSLDRWSSGSW